MVFGFGADPTASFLPPQLQRNHFTPPTLTPPKRRQTPPFLPPRPLCQTTLSWQTTTSSSSLSSSIKERVWPCRIILSHVGRVHFSDEIDCSHCFLRIKREAWSTRLDLLAIVLLVSFGAWWRRRLSELQRWTYSGKWEILSMEGEERERERERELEINLWWDYLKERI